MESSTAATGTTEKDGGSTRADQPPQLSMEANDSHSEEPDQMQRESLQPERSRQPDAGGRAADDETGAHAPAPKQAVKHEPKATAKQAAKQKAKAKAKGKAKSDPYDDHMEEPPATSFFEEAALNAFELSDGSD